MHSHARDHLSDSALRHDLVTHARQESTATATLLMDIAAFDARRLYLPEGYTSMHAYCVDVLHLSEDAAFKRIQAARAARQLPILFTALSESRLHLAALCLLAPHLTPGNADELVAAATHKSKSAIEAMLAQRFGRRESPSTERPTTS